MSSNASCRDKPNGTNCTRCCRGTGSRRACRRRSVRLSRQAPRGAGATLTTEQSSGPKRRIGAITKTGDVHARTLLIEAAHSYRFPVRIARDKLTAVDAVPEAVRAIAWKAQTRLCQRYRHMLAKGKLKPIVVTAIARELAGFVWAIACITSDPPAKSAAVTTASEEVCPTESTSRCRAPRRAGRPGQVGVASAQR